MVETFSELGETNISKIKFRVEIKIYNYYLNKSTKIITTKPACCFSNLTTVLKKGDSKLPVYTEGS
jgi:hypothetical protein